MRVNSTSTMEPGRVRSSDDLDCSIKTYATNRRKNKMQTIIDMKICVIYNRPRKLIGGGNHKRGSKGHNVINLLVHCSWRLTNHIPVSTNPPRQPQHIARPLHHRIPALLPRSFHPLPEPCDRYHHSPKLQTTCQTFPKGTAIKPHAAFTTPP
jgi:hypothetical protein